MEKKSIFQEILMLNLENAALSHLQFLTSSGIIGTIELEAWRIKCRSFSDPLFEHWKMSLTGTYVLRSAVCITSIVPKSAGSVHANAFPPIDENGRVCSIARACLLGVDEWSKRFFEFGDNQNTSNSALGEVRVGRAAFVCCERSREGGESGPLRAARRDRVRAPRCDDGRGVG